MRPYEVRSRIIERISYNPDEGNLLIRFRKGSTHCYRQVPAGVYAALMNAPSIGRFYQKNIRTRFQYERIE